MAEPAVQSPKAAEASGLLNNFDEKLPHWQPGVIRRFPWLELGGLSVAILSVALAIVVLTQSDDKNVDDWADIIPTRPSVLLGILTAISSIALGGIITQGVAIAWWRRAMYPTTIGSLQRSWDHGTSALSCLTAGNKITILAVATLATKLVPVDSALLQRATTTGVRTITRTLNVSSSIATEFPFNWYRSALMTGGNLQDVPIIFTSEFSSVLRAYQSLGSGSIDPVTFGPKSLFNGCWNGTCDYSVEGIGFAVECSSSITQIDYGENTTQNWESTKDIALPKDAPIFLNTFALEVPLQGLGFNVSENFTFIRMTSQYMQSKMGKVQWSCPGTLITKECDFRPAVVRYPLTQTSSGIIVGGNASSLHTNTRQVDGNSFVRYLFQDGDQGPDRALSAIGGIQLALSALLTAKVTLSAAHTPKGVYSLALSGPLAPYYVSSLGQTLATSGACNYTIQDPTPAVVRDLNIIMFLLSMQIASTNNSIPAQTILANQTLQVQFYMTNYRFMAGGIAVAVIGILGVTVPYYGFWQLGRKVTLGPFETANALRAPLLLSDESSSGATADLLKQAGDRPLRYGFTTTPGGFREDLALATPENVSPLLR